MTASDWDAPERRPPEDDEDALILALDGFEGPLDLLLVLARNQKVDLTKISILRLAEQYLEYIEVARVLRLEVAADYLVMAAWLAYLKSKLLLPEKEQVDDGPTGQELAAQLAFRLKRLGAMREALASIMGRKQLGIDMFGRGMPEGIRVVRSSVYEASIFDLLKAYAEQRSRTAVTEVKWGGRVVWSIKQARTRLASSARRRAGLGCARQVPGGVQAYGRARQDRHRIELRRHAGAGPRRLHRNPPAPRLWAALHQMAEARAGRGGGRRVSADIPYRKKKQA